MKIVLIVLLCIIALIVLLFLFPIFVRAHYEGEDIECYAWVGPFKVDVLADAEKKEQKRKKREQWRKDKSTLDWVKRRIQDYLDDLKQILELLPILRRVLKVDKLFARVRFHKDDPADNAMAYGESWAVIGGVMAVLQGLFDIRRQDVAPEDKPTADGFELEFHINLHLNLFNAVRVVTKYYEELGNYPDIYNYKNKKTKSSRQKET
ncbi:MAG: hypothetical protein MJ085_03725 [Clostridia bacterium]|nr:hypothetical protein [Clostridia bacterium]